MKRLGILLGVISFAVCAPCAEARPKNQIQIQCQIFKFTGNVPSKTFVDETIWTTEETPEKLKDKVMVFSQGWFQLGKDKLEFKDGNCFWKHKVLPIDPNQKVKLPEDQIRLIYSPDIVMPEHSKRTVKIESEQPIQYFVKRKDGLFELKEIKLPTGLDIEIEAKEEEDKGYILLTDMVMTMRSVEKRKKIEGVNLSVGQPILGKQEYRFFFRVRPGKDYGILIRPEHGQGGLLIRLRVSSTRSGTFRRKDKPPPESVLRHARIFVPHMEVTDWEFDVDGYEIICERGDEEYKFEVTPKGELTELQYKNDEADIEEDADHLALRGTKKSIAVADVPKKALATLAKAYPGLKPSKAWTAETIAGPRYVIQIGEMAFYARPDGQIQAGERIDKGALDEIDPPSKEKDR